MKKILSLLLVICMLLCTFSLVACGKDNNEGENNNDSGNNDTNKGENNVNTYTVTVIDKDNNPIAGVKLVITDGNTYPTATTDASGKASVMLPKESSTVSVMVTSVPDGYEKPEKVSGVYHGVFAKDATEFTLKVEKKANEKVTYTVKVVDQNGNYVDGMEIQLCPDGVCLAEKFITNENGEITAELAPGKTVKIKLMSLDGYVLPTADSDGYHATIESGSTETVITVSAI